jgi:hypothetical protein
LVSQPQSPAKVELGTPVGEPQLMIITDEKAFLGGKSESGARLVNDTYLKENGIYPLQAKTVSFVSKQAQIGSTIVAMLGLGSAFWAWRAAARKGQVSNK